MRILKNNFFFRVLISVGVIIISQTIIHYYLYQSKEDSKIINLAGRQRMLSQKINLQYLELLNGDTLNNDIQKTFNDWQLVHYALINGNNVLNIKSIKNKNINALLVKQTPKILLAGKILLQKPNLSQLKILKQNQALFLTVMEGVVNDLDKEANQKLLFIIFLEIFLFLLSLIVFGVAVFAIYRPLFREQKLTLKKAELSENKLQAILNSTTDSNFFISPEFKIINFNNASQLGVKQFYNKDVAIDQDFKQYVIKGTEDIFYKNFAICLKGEIVSSESNLNIFGLNVWFCNTFFPVYDSKNKIIGVSFNSTNIDKRKKAEIKVQAQLKQLKEIAWQQSHLIRSPMVNIIGLTNLLVDNKNDSSTEEKDIFEKLLQEVNRLDYIIADIVKNTINT